jgi:hypothetical protein
MRSAAATPRSEHSPPLPLCTLRVPHTHWHTNTTALQSPLRAPHTRGGTGRPCSPTFILVETNERLNRAQFASRCAGCRGMKMTPPEEEPVLDGARSSRGEEGAQHQFDGARPDAGAPRLARLTARARERRTSARRASPGLPQSGDPSALRARAPSLTHQPPTACACLTPLQASTSQAWPRAASAARWAAGRRQAAFSGVCRRLSRRAGARRALCASPGASRGALSRYRHELVETRVVMCGSAGGASVLADAGSGRAPCASAAASARCF